ncbi:hypothetical protein C7460_12626 [Marinoscillum furvescens DSM 4134]|uniref:Lipoprotein n=1 Tax=Marinoscillum furvescens DSM 4134 TaxID=1122208 RepID=A0A3D9KX22_MARFU|nr:hypothetical protein C7460_12626 [Marinoscillum furvescens DSM 4134]
MHKWRGIGLLVLLSLAVTFSACRKGPSSSIDKKRQIKKGKPIPCPIKDC